MIDYHFPFTMTSNSLIIYRGYSSPLSSPLLTPLCDPGLMQSSGAGDSVSRKLAVKFILCAGPAEESKISSGESDFRRKTM